MRKHKGGNQEYKADLIAEILLLSKKLKDNGKGNVKFVYKGGSSYVIK